MLLNIYNNENYKINIETGDEQVLLIKKAIKEGLKSKSITEKYPFANYKNIYAIKHNLSYKLIKDNTEVS